MKGKWKRYLHSAVTWCVLRPQPCTKPPIQLQGEFTSSAPHQHIRVWVRRGCLHCVLHTPVTQYAGGVTPSSVIREILGEGGWTLWQNYGVVSHRYAYTCVAIFVQVPECTQTRGNCDMDEGKTHEDVAHEKLVTRLARLRDAASEAVLWEDHAKLVQVAKAFTNITPTKRAIAETGVGHLLADKTLWARGVDAAVSLATKALTDWKEKVKHTYYDRRSTTAGRRELTAMKAKVYMNYVNDFLDWLKTVDELPADPVCRKRLAATLVQHSVLHWKHLDSIDPESLQVQHPTQAALLRRATAQATRCGRN